MATTTIRELIPLSNDAVSGIPIAAYQAQYLANTGVTAGVRTPSACLTVDASGTVDALDIDALSLNGVLVQSTATELNYLDGVSPGNNLINKAPILSSNGDLNLQNITGDVNCVNLNASGIIDAGASITAASTITATNNFFLVSPGTNSARVELGYNRTNRGSSYIDFSTSAGADYNARIARWGSEPDGVNSTFNIYQRGTGNLQFHHEDSAGKIVNNVGGITRTNITKDGLQLQTGARINEFSTATNLANSNIAVPTEGAVKTYVDSAISAIDTPQWRLVGSQYNLSGSSIENSTNISSSATQVYLVIAGMSASITADVRLELKGSSYTGAGATGDMNNTTVWPGTGLALIYNSLFSGRFADMVVEMKKFSDNTWSINAYGADDGSVSVPVGGQVAVGRITINAALTKVRLSPSAGNWDAGNVRMYQYY